MSESTALAVRPKASQQLAALIGMEPGAMLDTIKAQCFKCPAQQVSNEQLAAFVSIAAEMGINPLLPGQLYAYPTSNGGVVPIMGPAGVYKKLMEHPEVDSWETTVYPEDVALPPTHAITLIFRKGRDRPLKYTALLSEWKVGSNPNWSTRPRHMLALRSLKHAAAQIIHGIPGDEDDRTISGEVNVTPQAAETVTRAEPPARAKKGASAVKAEPAAIEVATTTVTEAAKVVTPEPAKVAEAVATPAPEKVAEKVVTPEPVAEPAAAEPAATPAPVARAFLKDGEEIIGVCTVEKVSGLIINKAGVPTPSVQAQVKGAFSGVVYHIGGGKKVGDAVEPDGAWANGVDLKLTLLGKLNTKAGKIQVWVQKAEASADEAVIEA